MIVILTQFRGLYYFREEFKGQVIINKCKNDLRGMVKIHLILY